ncbi:MAG: protein kinase, partial [Okeania sp. SIO2H7]|nr:protein kinase [Okeania sp. SIO2H7]
MILIPGYSIKETILTEKKTILYKGLEITNEQPVLLKTFQVEDLNLEDVTQFKQEYQISQKIACSGILKCYELKIFENNLALILEDFSCLPLSQFPQKTIFSIADFLRIAISLSETLGELHKQSIIHNQIEPKNIFINPQTKEVKLTGLGRAIIVPTEQQTIRDIDWQEDSFAYISPEQTGRINRFLDYRTDFYSLGITFYEILTGTVPFSSEDRMEMLYSHI